MAVITHLLAAWGGMIFGILIMACLIVGKRADGDDMGDPGANGVAF